MGRIVDKRTFYSQPKISATYDEQRFGGPSGARVNAREIGIALEMIPPEGRVLDLACGTGRLARALADRGQEAIGLDYSPPMATRAAAAGVPAVIGDGFATPFAGGTFDAVVSLRFAFHYAELGPLLAEMRRLGRPGAALVFDTYSWSPRSVIPFRAQRWGGVVHLHSRREVAEAATHIGLRVERVYPCFLFSPYLYRLVPLPLERALEAIEPRVPSSLLCRVFWKLLVVKN